MGQWVIKKATPSSPQGASHHWNQGRLVGLSCKDALKYLLARASPQSSGLELLLSQEFQVMFYSISHLSHVLQGLHFRLVSPAFSAPEGWDPITFYLVTTEGVQ